MIAVTAKDRDILARRIFDVLAATSTWYDDKFCDLFEDYALQAAIVLVNDEVDDEAAEIEFATDNTYDEVSTEIRVDSNDVKFVWEYCDPYYGVIVSPWK